MDKNIVKLGGLWANKTRDGKTFLSGSLGYSAQFMVFKNEYKKAEKDPDYIIYLGQKEKKEKQDQKPANDTDSEDIPF